MNLIERFARWLERMDNPWPDAVPLPPHVQAVKLDEKLLLHMMEAYQPTDRTKRKSL
jgi:hypothetical protein